MENLTVPNLLLIAGTGRNSGKTTMACSIIKEFATTFPIVAIKICPHFHENVNDLKPVYAGENIYVGEEISASDSKDSSRMLAAGARRSFFVMTRDEHLPEAWQQILSLFNPGDFIVCESGGLRNLIIPGLFLMMSGKVNPVLKPDTARFKSLCDRLITFDGERNGFNVDAIKIQDHSWKLIR